MKKFIEFLMENEAINLANYPQSHFDAGDSWEADKNDFIVCIFNNTGESDDDKDKNPGWTQEVAHTKNEQEAEILAQQLWQRNKDRTKIIFIKNNGQHYKTMDMPTGKLYRGS